MTKVLTGNSVGNLVFVPSAKVTSVDLFALFSFRAKAAIVADAFMETVLITAVMASQAAIS